MKTILLTVMGTIGMISAQAPPPPPAQPAPAPQAAPPAPAAPRAVKMPGASYIGVMVQEIDSDRAKALKLREEAGVEITRVDPDSPAEHAGLKVNDAIAQFNGQRVEGIEQFSRMVRETPAGREVRLEVVRNGAPQTLNVKVGARRANAMMLTPMAPTVSVAPRLEWSLPDIPRSYMGWRSSSLGVEAESLEGQLAEYFGVKEGVLIRSVSKSSPAEKAGLKAGDVITRVDDSRISTPADISSRIRGLRGKAVPVMVMRDHKEMTLSVTIESDDRAEWWIQHFQNAPATPRAAPVQ
jgi:serine protease Do